MTIFEPSGGKLVTTMAQRHEVVEYANRLMDEGGTQSVTFTVKWSRKAEESVTYDRTGQVNGPTVDEMHREWRREVEELTTAAVESGMKKKEGW